MASRNRNTHARFVLLGARDTGRYGFAGAGLGELKLNSTFGGVSVPSLAANNALEGKTALNSKPDRIS